MKVELPTFSKTAPNGDEIETPTAFIPGESLNLAVFEKGTGSVAEPF
jgi:hypothetical protein